MRHTVQSFPAELNWCNATIAAAGGSQSFLETFCYACLRADGDNYLMLRPAILYFMLKYPPPPGRLAPEERDAA